MAISKKQEEQAARSFGLKGPYTKENLENHKRSDPVFARKMAMVEDKLNMRKGGVVKLSEGGGRVGQFGGTVSPEYQRIQDEREANKAAVEKKDLGIDTDKGGLGEDNPAPLNILPDVPANDSPPVADDPATVVDDPPPADDPAPASVPTPVADTGSGDIKSLFKTLLKRNIGADALKHYEDRLAAGESIGDISNSIVNSEEYKTLNKTTPDKPTAESVTASTVGYDPNQNVKFDKIKDTDVNVIDDATELTAEQVDDPTRKAAVTMDTTSTIDDVKARLDKLEAEQGVVSDKAQVDAITQDPTTSEVGKVKAAELDSSRVIKGTTRKLQDDELVSGPTVDQARVETDVIAKTQAAQLDLDPAATIKGQLTTLYQDFKPSNPPAWADGAVRTAMATLSARGMGASSLAGQAVVQAVMESALPIAQVDAKTVFDLGIQNLSNRQATVILAAEQRAAFLGQEFDQAFKTKVANAAKVSEIANLNFNAETQIAIENAQLAQTVDLANLTNRQAVIMAEAAQIANLETTNLTNRQAAAIQNAQSFLQMDLKNLENKQQTNLFKAQEQIKSLFTDAAAENAAAQFNASSENQVTQFYDSLSTQVKQFNATQTNATEQFNVSQSTAIDQFNAQQRNAIDQFNASNGLVVSQANAEWRRNIATIDTAAQNQANQFNAQMAMSLTQREYEGMWQEYRDSMTFAHETGENQLDRESQQFIALLNKQAAIESAKFAMTGELYQAGGTLAAAIASGSNLFGKGGLITSVVNKGIDVFSDDDSTNLDDIGLTDDDFNLLGDDDISLSEDTTFDDLTPDDVFDLDLDDDDFNLSDLYESEDSNILGS